MDNELTTRQRIELKQRIDHHLDELYDQATQLGQEMAKQFKNQSRSQLRNLETVAGAATRTSALKNHVKNQTGKDRLRHETTWTWARGEPSLGARALSLLVDLAGRATAIAKALPLDDEAQAEQARAVEIELQRGVVQTAVCAALYGDVEAQR